MGELAKEVLKLQFDERVILEFHGAGVTGDAIDTIMAKNPRRFLVGE
jgi:predicted metal-dependent phosphotriesterase family hydrolase